MTSAHVLGLEGTILIQTGFLSAMVFLLLYTLWHNWWTTLHGAALASMALGVSVVLLRPVLFYWHVLGNQQALLASRLLAECRADKILHYTHALTICATATKIARTPPDLAEWITIQFLILVPLAFLVLCYQLIRKNRTHQDGTITGSRTERHLTDSR